MFDMVLNTPLILNYQHSVQNLETALQRRS